MRRRENSILLLFLQIPPRKTLLQTNPPAAPNPNPLAPLHASPLPSPSLPAGRPLSPSPLSASPTPPHLPSPPLLPLRLPPSPLLLLSAAAARSRGIRIRRGARLGGRGRVPAGHGAAAPAHGAERRPPCAQAGPWAAGRVPITCDAEEARSTVRRRRGRGRACRSSFSTCCGRPSAPPPGGRRRRRWRCASGHPCSMPRHASSSPERHPRAPAAPCVQPQVAPCPWSPRWSSKSP